jgi:hypothetical protein
MAKILDTTLAMKCVLLFVVTAVLSSLGCTKDVGPSEPFLTKLPTDMPRKEVPAELVGAWEHGALDFTLWENYKTGYYAGRNATPTREAMVFSKNGDAKFYRYEFAFGLYEELIDCEGAVTFDDETFTFTPTKGRKRFIDARHPANSKDRALTEAELKDPKLAGKRRYAYVTSSDPAVLRITVPSSMPYNWYKKPMPGTVK